ncbi:LCP family glycopolymer transferase [Radiobacillus deserti]|uniref:Transcriptional regulator LytR n=1 Tax=Radiobacillus deserti TaxID=2594883 RepID=A0A516KJ11_9BACI|nr:LCP family protein [Radiobacillus deserti]QDP41380.1 transcriptional regulator LytR [Radiobacillus deserti]
MVTESLKGKKSKRWMKIICSIIAVFLLATGGYVYSIYHEVKQTVTKEIHQQVGNIDTEATKEKMKEQEKLNILLLGVDERESDSGRSDALMVMSLDPSTDSMQLISIPRDTRAEIVGRGTEEKINHAYSYGGVEMAINTVENFLDTDLDYYVRINMEGLTDMVDAVGGITVTNEIDWFDEGYYQKGYHFEKGDIQLDGAKALGYVRMRHFDPNGDFGRTKRQRQVIQGIIEQGASITSFSKIDNILDVLGKNVVTNMDFEDMQDLFANYRDTRHHFTSYMVQGEGTSINGTYYLVVSDDEIEKVHSMLEKSTS